MVVGLTIRRRATPLSIGSRHRPQTRSVRSRCFRAAYYRDPGTRCDTAAGVTRRAGYGAAPPASRVAARSAARRPAAALDPGASTTPDGPTAGAGQGPAPGAPGAR